MGLTDDLRTIARQEHDLQFDRFDEDAAWTLGTLLRAWGHDSAWPIVIEIRSTTRPLFVAALPGSVPDNFEWVRRKRNTVERHHRSSYAIGLELALQNETLETRYGLSVADYAAHGGSFPLILRGTGVIGSITVSGLPQRDDHDVVVRALCTQLGLTAADYALPDPATD
ncbi:hypothetical protein AA103196_2215 [Ameyamaea chiangmaiensis NBRC 103196]|uniref:UPF0303 protein HUK82_13250 n=1 Tax=Ameyamaea chiangmaiensis TaxID=442969 RepID=A0A850PI87_9PROT|nr:heme-degrading domain-containing protein [Ameyamaea chiangmaiensis]MBS4075525.1 heme-degrading domain-containing protein [Ameyamaea chiangmaiensis]NVN41522.1 heme-degrading domain-containing protein [Ameyamaea chiangmaiensis]GBQ69433.1 hypothetical protein AA103196_2215 [Ameyamaea chiangmaiensis NBRC 103196]